MLPIERAGQVSEAGIDAMLDELQRQGLDADEVPFITLVRLSDKQLVVSGHTPGLEEPPDPDTLMDALVDCVNVYARKMGHTVIVVGTN